mmetsp:Transcript_4100/g.5011  ORF Transcript_4100/g.5011 Transcript_4100/m.5011 type:complete len:83 (-) Transcript_4100:363-611(-)
MRLPNHVLMKTELPWLQKKECKDKLPHFFSCEFLSASHFSMHIVLFQINHTAVFFALQPHNTQRCFEYFLTSASRFGSRFTT